MAHLQLRPPEPFDFKNPDDWIRWKRRFEQFRVASGLSGDNDERQVSTLLYCLGEEAETVLSSTNPTAEDRKEYDKVVQKLDGFFQVRKNVIFERARFNKRNQREGESAENYITALYELVETCEFGAMKSEMLRDRMVVGIRDSALSERLQLDADLTLEKATKSIRQREAVHEQQSTLQGGAEPSSIAVTQQKRRGNKQPNRGRRTTTARRTQQSTTTPKQAAQCGRCGREAHPRDKCPAKDAECHRCNKKGHYGAMCRSKRTAYSEAATNALISSEAETAFLDNLTPLNQETAWTTTIQVDGKAMTFKLDTGAEVTAISAESYRHLKKPHLTASDKILYGPSRQPLKVLGQLTARLDHKGKSSRQKVYVVEGLKTNLLGLPAITALHLAARLDVTANNNNDITASYGENIRKEFPKVFNGLGNLGEEFSIKLKPDATPHSTYTARHVPLPLRPQVEAELQRMESLGVISKVDKPTQWCAGMVVVPKKNGKVRICVDLKHLNENVLREVHPLPKVDETLAQLSGAKVFSKLDANSGFWQIPLDEPSRQLTTFITPVGRYQFNKLPFGISSAPEHFQKRMSAILSGLPGVVCQMDDVLVFGSDQKQHDERLTAVLKRLESANVTLNPEKCKFSCKQLDFLGHVIDENGVRADPAKTSALQQMQAPQNVTELRRFLGMANQLGKFSPQLAAITQPLRELLSKNRQWTWGSSQERAFNQVKEELSKPTVLALYNPQTETKVSADASSHGLGAVLLQKTQQDWQPVAYASRSLTETERRYAQIEKEALAITWACEKFAMYILGKRFEIETDHKPLVPILGTKALDSLPPRVLRFRLRLARFDYLIQHVPGKHLYTADCLSRAPSSEQGDQLLEGLAELASEACVAHLPAGQDRLQEYREAQQSDPLCTLVTKYCKTGWPHKNKVDEALAPYWEARGSLTLHGDLLLYSNRIVVPASMQQTTLSKIHQGHQGIERCRQRARTSVWWPGISNQIQKFVQSCQHCAAESSSRKEPLMPTPLPEYPWQKIATDLFTLKGKTYIVVIDYFSRYLEVATLSTTTSTIIISILKSLFARYGIPEEVVSDNGPQYASQEFADFAKQYNFHHTTSSPHFPQSNGHAERAVQTAKRLLKNASDPNMALLAYRSTPLPWCGLSPAQLLMGRHIRSNIPQRTTEFIPDWSHLEEFRVQDNKQKQKQKANYDNRHGVRPLPDIPNNTAVWVTSDNARRLSGHVASQADTPRSYLVQTPSGEIRRNRSHLIVQPHSDSPPSQIQTRSPIMTRSRTGATICPPERL